jgi:glycopeptide antibiotics resistance protein
MKDSLRSEVNICPISTITSVMWKPNFQYRLQNSWSFICDVSHINYILVVVEMTNNMQ